MKQEELQRVRDWADEKIATGVEPPWAWFQFMKLREVLDEILAGQAAVKTESLRQSESRSESGPRLAVSNTQPSSAPHHQPTLVTRLPT